MEEDKEVTHVPHMEQGEKLKALYNHLNDELFDGALPMVYLKLDRTNRFIRGHYAVDVWTDEDGIRWNEININANAFANGDFKGAVTVFVHEMVHHWQQTWGMPSRTGYHNAEYAGKCRDLGIECIDPETRKPVNAAQNMDCELIEGGKLEEVIYNLPDEMVFPYHPADFELPGNEKGGGEREQGRGGENPEQRKPKTPGKRSKYTCAQCGTNVWGKSGLSIVCGICGRAFVQAPDKE